MADPSVTERRIRPIQDAVAIGNWKQALQQCDKWQKKGEKSDKFLTLKAHVLVNTPDKALQERGRKEILELCNRQTAITDLDAIYQLQDTLKDLSLQNEEGPKLWDRAVAAKPTDKELLMTWLNHSIVDSNWRSAQKAAMALRKAFPTERQHDFWNILLCYLIHQDQSLQGKDRTLFGTLAYRLVSKAAELVPENQDELLTSGKAISSLEELCLLIHVYMATGHSTEAVDLLRNPKFGLTSRIGLQDPQMALSLLLQALHTSERWKDANDICQELLKESNHQHDDRIWNLLLESAQRLAGETETSQSIATLFTSGEQTRTAKLARLSYLSGQSSNSETSSKILDAITDYYNDYQTKVFCFGDLVAPLQAVNQEDISKFRESLASEVSMRPTSSNRLFLIKLDYVFINDNYMTQSKLIEISKQSLELYQSTLQDSPCPEAALIAAMALLRVGVLIREVQFIFRAALLIQTCASNAPDYHPFSVLLIECYSHLGLYSLAMGVFEKLGVKNVQWETVGHLLLARISTLHPSAARRGKEVLNPAGGLDASLAMLERSDQALIRGVREGLKYGSYSNIISSVEMRSDLQNSLNKQIVIIEERKIGRRIGDLNDTILEDRPASIVDRRDLSFLTQYSKFDTKVHDHLRCGPLLKEEWVDVMALIDHVITYMKLDIASQPTSEVLARLESTGERMKIAVDNMNQYLTKPESSAICFYNGVAQIIVSTKDASSITKDATSIAFSETVSRVLEPILVQLEFDSPSDKLTEKPEIAGIQIPAWSILHRAYVNQEFLQVLSLFLAWSKHLSASQAKSKAKSKSSPTGPPIFTPLSKEKIAELVARAKKLETGIIDSMKKFKERIDQPGVLGTLVDVSLCRSEPGNVDDLGATGSGNEPDMSELNMMVEQVCNEVAIEDLCGKVKESWEDAISGVLNWKMIKWP